MSTSHRVERVAAMIQAELSRALIEDVSDPSLKEVGISRVEVTKDLKHARVFFVPYGEVSRSQEKEMSRGFSRASAFFKRQLATKLELRYVPVLDFERDRVGPAVQNVLRLIGETVETERKGPTH